MLEDSYNGYIKSIPKRPYPTLKGIQFMLDVLAPTLPQAKNFKPEQFVDLSFCRNSKRKASLARWRNAIRANKRTGVMEYWSDGMLYLLE